MYKSHTCGELNVEHVGQEVRLAGWVDRLRDLGGVNFIDLRDRFGKVQIVAREVTYGHEKSATNLVLDFLDLKL